MAFTPDIAQIRFGEGLSPAVDPPSSVDAILQQLRGPDVAAEAFPIPLFSSLHGEFATVTGLQRAMRKGRNGPDADELTKTYKQARRALNVRLEAMLAPVLSRSITTSQPFRERITRFWADHFTVVGKSNLTVNAVPTYVEEAIRPHVAGRFADMLKAVMVSPMMLEYLDQNRSVGPNSAGAKGRRGLNENLARELLELHTLGVEGAYKQSDVRQLAELLTGMSTALGQGFLFRGKIAEPGAETVLGHSYGGGQASVDDVMAFLEDVAHHPDTARHLARKLAVHFTSDIPDEGLISQMADAYLASKGELMAVYDALLRHPFAWDSFGQKIKQPMDFVCSALRVLEVPPASLQNLNRAKRMAYITSPMAGMGQQWLRPSGPDGWPEEAEAWVTPQGLAARIQWAMAMPSAFFRGLPDPREFVGAALGSIADEKVNFAARAAETRREGVGLILASPAFQRR
ncbi:DUF1800 domain-containing protein [Litoreibacter janthinus]|uniref:Uncharacterized conserved protein, DUF1800 family n=1 Tax=Litoreibacter janthinus TaxID=670154 RepID=A0A1I6GGA0_9RHOB|nr:DUF1800 domain-containing protein [Litoreibacter janthinus]SFR41243.1 Uncharacterized conserved protein, DUF1800 family [Litoreibacter janthinus]